MSKTIIYGATLERAYDKLDLILENIPYGKIKSVRKSKNNYEVITKNNNVYLAIKASEGSRGLKWAFSYIDGMIEPDIISKIILPSFYPENKQTGDFYIIADLSIKNNYRWFG